MNTTVDLNDRNVGTLNIKSPLPHHLSPAPNTPKLSRHNSETSVTSPSTTPRVTRSSSFTGSKRFLTGKGLSARESLGIIDQPIIETHHLTIANVHFDYQAARSIIMDTLTHSAKQPPPPPHPTNSPPLICQRPPTPPPMPNFSTSTPSPYTKRVRIDPKPPIEHPPPTLTQNSPTTFSTPNKSPCAKHLDKKRTPLRPLSPLRNRLSLSPSPPSRPTLFGLFSSRITRREGLATSSPPTDHSTFQKTKQNAAPLNIADITKVPKVDYSPRRTDENNNPVFDVTDTSSDDSPAHNLPNPASRTVPVDQIHPSTEQRLHIPLGRSKKLVPVAKDNESVETTESEKYKDCESPISEPRRRVEIFRRFRFVQEGRHRPEQLSDFVQTDVLEDPQEKEKHLDDDIFEVPSEPVDPISHHEDKMSFTSVHDDGEPFSDEQPPLAIRDIRKDPRHRMRLPRIVQPELKLFEEEKGHLPHVESVTTSSSSHSKDTSDSPTAARKMEDAIHDASILFAQIEMPHLRLGKGNVSAHAFLNSPSPSKMGKVAHLRRDSHAAFLNLNRETKLEEIKYGGHQGERDTTPLGPSSSHDAPNEGGEIKKTMSGLQRKLKEAGAELVSKAKKIPRSASFAKLRSNSLKDLRSGNSGKEPETEEETEIEKDTEKGTEKEEAQRKAKGMERSKSLPSNSMRKLPKSVSSISAPANHEIERKPAQMGEQKPPQTKEQKAEEDAGADITPEMPEFVTIKRIIRRVRRDGTEETITKKVRVRPERILPNGDVVIKRTMKRNKDDGAGTEKLNVLQVIPRRKNVKKAEGDGSNEDVTKDNNSVESLPDLRKRQEDKDTTELGRTAQHFYNEGPLRVDERSGSPEKRRSSGRSKTDMVDEGGRWRRARSFGRAQGETETRETCEQGGGIIEGVKGILPRMKGGARDVDRDTEALGGFEDGKTWLKKKSLPRMMSFHGRGTRRKESGASSKSEGSSWWRFRRAAA